MNAWAIVIALLGDDVTRLYDDVTHTGGEGELGECVGHCDRTTGCPQAVQGCRACLSSEG